MLQSLTKALLGMLLLSGSASGRPPSSLQLITRQYRLGLNLDRYNPSEQITGKPAASLLLVHGCCGDRHDMAPLARTLARKGFIVFNADVTPFGHGGGWPTSYTDVVCAYAAGRADARSGGFAPPVIVGWDDGALLSAAVLLGWSTLSKRAHDCASPTPDDGPHSFVGLDGHYGWTTKTEDIRLTGELIDWFGALPSVDPQAWELGNPGWWARRLGPGNVGQMLLVTGGPDAEARSFGGLVAGAGFDVSVRDVGAGTHADSLLPRDEHGHEILDVLLAWLAGLPANQISRP